MNSQLNKFKINYTHVISWHLFQIVRQISRRAEKLGVRV